MKWTPYIAAALGAGTGFVLFSGDSLKLENLSELQRANLDAFLRVIREGESSDNYAALVGGGEFSDFTDHPAITGEFKGILRDDGRLTTAAGAYQIVRSTWRGLGGVKRYGSFGPEAQDRAAIDLIRGRGALDMVLAGQADKAAHALRQEWEMFTLPRWSPERTAARFAAHGGNLA